MGDEHVHYPILTEKFAMAKPLRPKRPPLQSGRLGTARRLLTSVEPTRYTRGKPAFAISYGAASLRLYTLML
jgi:hypothetical protein